MNTARKHPPQQPSPADLDPQTGDWRRPYIRYRLEVLGYTLQEISFDLGLQRTAAVDALRGQRSRRVEAEIARRIGVEPQVIWPSRYPGRRGRRSVHPAG